VEDGDADHAHDGAHGDEQHRHDDEEAAVQGPGTTSARGIRARHRVGVVGSRLLARRGGVAGVAGTGHPAAFSM
jgi:hypothetical protein